MEFIECVFFFLKRVDDFVGLVSIEGIVDVLFCVIEYELGLLLVDKIFGVVEIIVEKGNIEDVVFV